MAGGAQQERVYRLHGRGPEQVDDRPYRAVLPLRRSQLHFLPLEDEPDGDAAFAMPGLLLHAGAWPAARCSCGRSIAITIRSTEKGLYSTGMLCMLATCVCSPGGGRVRWRAGLPRQREEDCSRRVLRIATLPNWGHKETSL